MHLVRHSLGGEGAEIADVGPVHSQDEVEGGEVRHIYLAAAQGGDVDPVRPCHRDRAPIRRVADVPGAGAGGIDRDRPGSARPRRELAHDALRQRRAADIAETNEENSDRFHGIQYQRAGLRPNSCATLSLERDALT
jgi:hypothetical protein